MRKNVLRIASTVTALLLVVAVCFVMQAPKADAGMARGSKFVGQIIASSVPSNFGTYWNQVTPENGGKWGSVQSQPGSTYNWGACDTAYNYARSNNMPFKYHCLVWGNQQPSNVTSASQVQTWIKAVAARYSGAAYVDVVNEPLHAVPSYSGVLGGSGSTGWDWVVWSFQQARAAFPSTTKLLINDYNVETDTTAANNYIKIINILKGKGLIDGIGIQCHQFTLDNASASSLSTCLNLYAQTGLPIYVSELDLTGDDATQLQRYQRIFPVLYEHPSVQGITLWGWIEGTTWKSGTHLITSSGQERPALQWLKTYLAGGTNNTPTPTRAGQATPTPTRPGQPTPTPNGSGTTTQCENMTLSGSYAAKISSPFSGVALYGNNDACYYTQYFANSTHSFSVRGCSNNSSAARVDLKIGGTTKGSFYFSGTTPTVQTLSNISHGTGNQEVRLTVTTDTGSWDAYVDYLQIQ